MMKFPRPLDRGLIASLVVGQLLVLLRWITEGVAGDGLGVNALLGLAAGLWLYLIVRTVRRMKLWKKQLPPLIYRTGVLGWGGMMWLTGSIVDAVQRAGGIDHLLSDTFAWALLVHAAIAFPISMWGGYFFGRMMGGIFGIHPDPAIPLFPHDGLRTNAGPEPRG